MKTKKSWYKRWWAIVLFIFIGIVMIGSIFGEDSSLENTDSPASTETSSTDNSINQNQLQKVLEETNVYRFRTLKGYDLTLDQVNPTSYSGIENIMEAYNILIRDNCGIEPPKDYFMISDTGTLLVIDAETYEVECDYLNLVDKDTGLDVPQNEMDSFLTKKENENLLDENHKEETDTATMGEKNALKSALSYLDFSAFSHSGLIEQLEYEGYTYEEAKYGVDNSGANWNEQAALSAQSYLDFSAFSRDGLIEQLEFEEFTREQAEYGVQAVGY